MRHSRPCPPLSPRLATVLGGVLAACGLALLVMMGALLVLVAQAWVGRPTVLGHLQFTGSPLVAGFGLVLFTALLAFGIAALHGGIWQIRHKRRAPALLRVAEYSFTALAIVGTAVAILIEANSWSLLDRLRQILCYRATAILD
jgi:hypothetical protein